MRYDCFPADYFACRFCSCEVFLKTQLTGFLEDFLPICDLAKQLAELLGSGIRVQRAARGLSAAGASSLSATTAAVDDQKTADGVAHTFFPKVIFVPSSRIFPCMPWIASLTHLCISDVSHTYLMSQCVI